MAKVLDSNCIFLILDKLKGLMNTVESRFYDIVGQQKTYVYIKLRDNSKIETLYLVRFEPFHQKIEIGQIEI